MILLVVVLPGLAFGGLLGYIFTGSSGKARSVNYQTAAPAATYQVTYQTRNRYTPRPTSTLYVAPTARPVPVLESEASSMTGKRYSSSSSATAKPKEGHVKNGDKIDVYLTRTGDCYHDVSCASVRKKGKLKDDLRMMTLNEAIDKGYTKCDKCYSHIASKLK